MIAGTIGRLCLGIDTDLLGNYNRLISDTGTIILRIQIFV